MREIHVFENSGPSARRFGLWALVQGRWPVDVRGRKPSASLANPGALTYDTLGGRGGVREAAASS